MTALGIFLLGLIILVLCPFLRQLLGAIVLFVAAMWAYGHFLLPPAREQSAQGQHQQVALIFTPPGTPALRPQALRR